jgi:predicted hotdog family 3-hydroxylacyl-ACP dehydratase
VGVIAAIKSLDIFRLPHRGEDLITTVEETMGGVMNMSIYNAEIKIGEELIAKGEIRVAITQ